MPTEARGNYLPEAPYLRAVLFFVKEYFPVPSSGGNQCKNPFGILANHKIKMCHNSMKKIMIQQITQNNWNFWTMNLIMRAKNVNQSSDFPVRRTGSYRHKKALLTRDKDLSKLYACDRVDTRQWHSQPLESTRHAGNYFVPISIRPIFIFIFLLQKLCQITWLLTGWKMFLYFRSPPPLRHLPHLPRG